MDEAGICYFCGRPIDVGEAWMAADIEGARAAAHAECVERETSETGTGAWWEPQEWGPNE